MHVARAPSARATPVPAPSTNLDPCVTPTDKVWIPTGPCLVCGARDVRKRRWRTGEVLVSGSSGAQERTPLSLSASSAFELTT